MSRYRFPTTSQLLLAAFAVMTIGTALLASSLRLATNGAQAQTPPNDTLLLQLAERLLGSSPPVSIPLASSTQSVQLLAGALPADLPLTLPMPPGSTLIGSAVRPAFSVIAPPIGVPGFVPSQQTPAGERTDIVIDATQSPEDIIAFYKSAMDRIGWSAPPAYSYGPIPPPVLVANSSATFCQSASGPWLSVSAATRSDGPADLRLHLERGTPGVCAAPAGPQNFVPPVFPGYGLLPSLRSPDGVTVRSNGSGGGQGRFTSDAIATTGMPLADLYTFYAQQLAAANWTQTDSGQSGGLQWSAWSISDHNDYQGFLYVRSGPAAGQFSLHAEVASTDPNASQTQSGGVYYSGAPITVAPTGPVVLPAASATATATATPAPER